VWGTAADDVWAVGGDAGDGATVLHWDGASWTRLDTGVSADLWWVFGFDGGPVYMGGSGGTILRYADGAFTPMTTPTADTVFGIWGATPDDVWAVGGAEGGASGGFAWRLDGDAWVAADGFPAAVADSKVVWKIHGSAADDVWLVGTAGLAIRWDGEQFTEDNLGGGESLFTVHQRDGRFVAVGGFATGLIFEHDGSGWERVSEPDAPPLAGVCALDGGGGFAVGQFGAVMERRDGAWQVVDGPATEETLHAVWVDPDGGAWAVGGQVQAFPLVRGVLAYRGETVPEGDIR
jgi:hypothetical protein